MVILKELNNMFWGLTIGVGQRYSQTVDRPFHVSMASLEINPQSPDKGSHVQVMLQQESSQFLLCTLGPGRHLQQQLDLHFSSGETIEFFLVGKGVVHLTGSLVGEQKELADDYREDEYDSVDLEEEPDSDDEEDEDWQPEELVGSKRKASKAMLGKKKKMKVTEPHEDDDDFIDDSALEEEEEEEEDESEEDEDDDSEIDVLTNLPTPPEKTSAMNAASEMSPASKKKKKNKQLKTGMEQEEKKGASSAGDASSGDATPAKKKKKRRRRKSKEEHGNQPEQSTNGSQEPQSPTPKSAPAVGKKRTVAGGTSVEDVKIGHGPEAKPGKMVSVYYSGILAKSNKRFDSCLNGKPFRFRLGRGEVIKGWDTGLIGMKVGGKRKIVVPPSQGYGNARQGPIPPGSILVFDVEMKAVN